MDRVWRGAAECGERGNLAKGHRDADRSETTLREVDRRERDAFWAAMGSCARYFHSESLTLPMCLAAWVKDSERQDPL